MKLKKLPEPYGQEFPSGYKFSWIAYNVKNDQQRILFDNHTNKPPHIHTNGHEEYFTWISLAETEKLFLVRTQQRFGHFEIELDKI